MRAIVGMNAAMLNSRSFALKTSLIASFIGLSFAHSSCISLGDGSSGATLGWKEIATPTQEQLDAVWGTSPSDIWAVGHEGMALHYDGSGWTQVPTGTSEVIFALWGASPDKYWAGTGDGDVLAWNGSEWAPDSWFAANNVDTSQGIASIHGSSANDVWVSTRSFLFHWDGSMWSSVAMPEDESFKNIHVIAPGEIWATGDSRNLYRKRGTQAWETFETPDVGGIFIWNDISGYSPTDMWAAGSALSAGGGVDFAYHWDGTSWSDVQFFDDPLVGPSTLEGIACQSATDVWMVGGFDNYHFDGSSWKSGSFGSNAIFHIWGSKTNELWSVGSVGAIFKHSPE